MIMLPLIFAFVLGAVIGSFLNVVSLRMNTGLTVRGRSMCMGCGTTLTWRELIPIASFCWQKGKCRNCKCCISWQYPLVEIGVGAAFALLFWKFPPIDNASMLTLFIYILCTCLLAVITVYDIRHKIIPDSFVCAFDVLAFATVFIGGAQFFQAPHLWTLLAGPLIALPFALLWLVSKGQWIGLGDAKLVLGIGWLLGLNAGVNSVIYAFWIGAIVSVVWMLATYGQFKKRLEVPFGPFLILGMYIVLLTGWLVVDLRLISSLLGGN
jgi:prepilin signal peptidase PulO-like enzyme (type II secretory pathway)